MILKTNFPQDSLHVVINQNNNSSPLNSIKLQFFGSETLNKTISLSAYHFHPDRKGFFSTIANFLFEFFVRKTAILVKVDAYSDPVYVKVDDLSKILGIKRKILTNETKKMAPSEVSSYLKMEASIKKIQEYLKKDIHKERIKERLLALSNFGIGLENAVILMSSSSDAQKNLNALAKRISYPTIEHLLDKVKTDDEKKIMLNTFIQIGQNIRANSKAKYFKATKIKKELEAHAYGISDQHIFIAISQLKGGKISDGTYKLVTSATKIDNFANQSLSQQVESYVRIKPNPRMIKHLNEEAANKNFGLTNINFGLTATNKNLADESKAMDIYLKNNPFAVDPYLFQAYSPTGKIVLFQKRFDGDGEKLFQASLDHQINALKELGKGLNYLHKQGVVHLDVKPPNLFIVGDINDPQTPVKGRVGDLGLLASKGACRKSGSRFYLPPEALEITQDNILYNPAYQADESADSYAYGITILETIFPRKSVEALKASNLVVYEEVPFFAGEVVPTNFQKKRDEFFEFVKKALFFPNPKALIPAIEIIKHLQVLDVCRNLIQFDPKNRISCGDAAKILEKIQLGNVIYRA